MLEEELVDIAARHQVYIERLKAGEIKKTDALFRRLDKDIQTVLLKLRVSDLSSLTRVEGAALVEDIKNKHVEAYTEHLDKLVKVLREFAEFEREFELEALNEVTTDEVEPDDGDFLMGLWKYIQERPMSATGKVLSAYLAAWLAHEVTRGADLARRAIAEGWSIDRLLMAYRGTREAGYSDGLWGSAKRNTSTTINTAFQHTSTATRSGVMEVVILRPKGSARERRPSGGESTRAADAIRVDADGRVTFIPAAAREAARLAGVRKGTRLRLGGYLWVSVLDSITSQICRSLDGRLFAFGKGPLPPAHPNCRSTIVADIPDRFSRSKRDNRPSASGPVPAGMTYYEWLKKQPEPFQNDALGVTRAELFRKGGLSAAAFARLNLGRTFEPLTLEEMRRLAPRAFKRAGI